MHLAVILTLFVSLSLVGVGVLLNQEAHRVADRWGSQLQITVYLCSRQDTNPACTGEVTPAQKAAIQKVVDTNTQVSTSHQESQAGRVRQAQGSSTPASTTARTRRSPPPTCRSRSGSR